MKYLFKMAYIQTHKCFLRSRESELEGKEFEAEKGWLWPWLCLCFFETPFSCLHNFSSSRIRLIAPSLFQKKANYCGCRASRRFLVACTRLYKPLCRSVDRSVGPSVGPSETDRSEHATSGDRPCSLKRKWRVKPPTTTTESRVLGIWCNWLQGNAGFCSVTIIKQW